MRVVSILGGLGSQMIKYAFYLAIKDNDDCYIDTTPFRLENMWNGYELETVFGIKDKDISDLITEDELLSYKELGDNYKSIAVKMINSISGNKKTISFFRGYVYPEKKDRFLYFLSLVYNKIKRFVNREKEYMDSYPSFYKTEKYNCFYDEFSFVSDKYLGGSKARKRLKDVFRFPEFTDDKNLAYSQKMLNEASVVINIRRTDHMYDNKSLYEDKYYQKAIQYIKDRVENPIFYIFSDDLEWCDTHREEIGLSHSDTVICVDWNREEDSFRDMQLMTYGKHNIMAISIFGWWGYYLSRHNYEDKITCAPDGYWLDAKVHL